MDETSKVYFRPCQVMSSDTNLANPLAVQKIAFMKAIGKKIRDARVKLKMSQAELGRRLGVTRNAVSNWEQGKNLPKGARMRDLAHHLRMHARELYEASPDVHGESPEDREQPEAVESAAGAKPPALGLSADPIDAFELSAVEPVLLADPRAYALRLQDRQGRSIAVSVDRTTIERLRSCLDVLKKFV